MNHELKNKLNTYRGGIMSRFLEFKELITTPTIKILYFIGAMAIIVAGLWMVYQGGYINSGIGVAILIFGNLTWRIACEGTIVIFNIHENLVWITHKLGKVK